MTNRKPQRRPTAPTHVARFERHEIRSGPLPAAEELQRYNEVHPGAAERIFRMAEKEQDQAHRLGWHEMVLKYVGTATGFILAAAAIALAFYMVHEGSDSIDKVIYSIGALVGVALAGRTILKAKAARHDHQRP